MGLIPSNDNNSVTADCLLQVSLSEVGIDVAQTYINLGSTDCEGWREACDLGHIAEQYTLSSLSNPFDEARRPDLFYGYELGRRQLQVEAIVAAG